MALGHPHWPPLSEPKGGIPHQNSYASIFRVTNSAGVATSAAGSPSSSSSTCSSLISPEGSSIVEGHHPHAHHPSMHHNQSRNFFNDSKGHSAAVMHEQVLTRQQQLLQVQQQQVQQQPPQQQQQQLLLNHHHRQHPQMPQQQDMRGSTRMPLKKLCSKGLDTAAVAAAAHQDAQEAAALLQERWDAKAELSGSGITFAGALTRRGPSPLDRGGPHPMERGGSVLMTRGGPLAMDRGGPISMTRGGPVSLDQGGPVSIDRVGPGGHTMDRRGPSPMDQGPVPLDRVSVTLDRGCSPLDQVQAVDQRQTLRRGVQHLDRNVMNHTQNMERGMPLDQRLPLEQGQQQQHMGRTNHMMHDQGLALERGQALDQGLALVRDQPMEQGIALERCQPLDQGMSINRGQSLSRQSIDREMDLDLGHHMERGGQLLEREQQHMDPGLSLDQGQLLERDQHMDQGQPMDMSREGLVGGPFKRHVTEREDVLSLVSEKVWPGRQTPPQQQQQQHPRHTLVNGVIGGMNSANHNPTSQTLRPTMLGGHPSQYAKYRPLQNIRVPGSHSATDAPVTGNTSSFARQAEYGSSSEDSAGFLSPNHSHTFPHEHQPQGTTNDLYMYSNSMSAESVHSEGSVDSPVKPMSPFASPHHNSATSPTTLPTSGHGGALDFRSYHNSRPISSPTTVGVAAAAAAAASLPSPTAEVKSPFQSSPSSLPYPTSPTTSSQNLSHPVLSGYGPSSTTTITTSSGSTHHQQLPQHQHHQQPHQQQQQSDHQPTPTPPSSSSAAPSSLLFASSGSLMEDEDSNNSDNSSNSGCSTVPGNEGFPETSRLKNNYLEKLENTPTSFIERITHGFTKKMEEEASSEDFSCSDVMSEDTKSMHGFSQSVSDDMFNMAHQDLIDSILPSKKSGDDRLCRPSSSSASTSSSNPLGSSKHRSRRFSNLASPSLSPSSSRSSSPTMGDKCRDGDYSWKEKVSREVVPMASASGVIPSSALVAGMNMKFSHLDSASFEDIYGNIKIPDLIPHKLDESTLNNFLDPSEAGHINHLVTCLLDAVYTIDFPHDLHKRKGFSPVDYMDIYICGALRYFFLIFKNEDFIRMNPCDQLTLIEASIFRVLTVFGFIMFDKDMISWYVGIPEKDRTTPLTTIHIVDLLSVYPKYIVDRIHALVVMAQKLEFDWPVGVLSMCILLYTPIGRMVQEIEKIDLLREKYVRLLLKYLQWRHGPYNASRLFPEILKFLDLIVVHSKTVEIITLNYTEEEISVVQDRLDTLYVSEKAPGMLNSQPNMRPFSSPMTENIVLSDLNRQLALAIEVTLLKSRGMSVEQSAYFSHYMYSNKISEDPRFLTSSTSKFSIMPPPPSPAPSSSSGILQGNGKRSLKSRLEEDEDSMCREDEALVDDLRCRAKSSRLGVVDDNGDESVRDEDIVALRYVLEELMVSQELSLINDIKSSVDGQQITAVLRKLGF